MKFRLPAHGLSRPPSRGGPFAFLAPTAPRAAALALGLALLALPAASRAQTPPTPQEGFGLFEPQDHCVAYRVENRFLFMVPTTVVGKNCQLEAAIRTTANAGKLFVEVSVPLKGFDSGISARNRSVAKLLGGEDFPVIHFISNEMEVDTLQKQLSGGWARVEGTLYLNGRKYPLAFNLAIYTAQAEGGWVVEGRLKTRLSAFDLEPPTAGPGGMVAEVDDTLELLVYLQWDEILGSDLLEPPNRQPQP